MDLHGPGAERIEKMIQILDFIDGGPRQSTTGRVEFQ